jgi:hypothetical protein
MSLLHLCGSAGPADCLSWPLCYIGLDGDREGKVRAKATKTLLDAGPIFLLFCAVTGAAEATRDRIYQSLVGINLRS